jgi:hypothetical protein
MFTALCYGSKSFVNAALAESKDHASWQISFGAENVLLSVILYNVGALVALFNG